MRLRLLVTAALIAAVLPLAAANPASAAEPLGFGFPATYVQQIEQQEGAQLTYSSVWAVGGDISGVDDAVLIANARGTIPVIHWYYWGVDSRRVCVDNWNNTSVCGGKTRERWNAKAQELVDLVYDLRDGSPAIITLELEFHNYDVHSYEPYDGYLETQANILGSKPGVSVALGWGEWADGDGSLATYNRAQAASDYAGTQLLWSCIDRTGSVYRGATERVLENAQMLQAAFGKPVLVYDYGLSSFSEALSNDSQYTPTDPNEQCKLPQATNYEIEQNAEVAEVFTIKPQLKAAGVIGFVFRELDDEKDRNPGVEPHYIAERWWGFRHNGIKKMAWNTVMQGIRDDNGGPQPGPDPSNDEWRREAESWPPPATGGTCTDGNASGGACWNIWSNGSIATTTSSVSAGTKRVTVVARGDPAAGIWPEMEVRVNGTLVMSLSVSRDTWWPYAAAITLAQGAHTIEVRFTNDGNVNGDDRNLLVDFASIEPATRSWTQEAESFPTATAGDDIPSTTASGLRCWNLWSNGYIETTMNVPYASQHELHVVARGRVAGGVWPNMEVSVDGQVVLSAPVTTTTWQTYRVRRVVNGGARTLRIRFTNDAIVGNEDRNLEVDVASLYT